MKKLTESPKNIKVRVAGYIRVSTRTQEKEGFSLPAQEETIKAYVQNDVGKELFKIYHDSMSGTRSDRNGLNSLMGDAKAGRFKEVVVYAIDRFGRSTEDLLRNVNFLKGLEINFISLRENIDLNSYIGKFFLTVLAALAELENEMRKERVSAGKIKKLENGKLNICRGVKFPLQWNEGKTAAVPESNKLKVFNLIKELRLKGMSLAKIADHLNSLPLVRRIRKKWYHAKIGELLNDHCYVDGFYKVKFQGLEKKLLFPPLMTEEEFQKLQFVAKQNSTYSPRTKGRPPLLSGLIYCGVCGSKLYGWQSGGYQYYGCANKVSPSSKNKRCPLPFIKRDKLERSAWYQLDRFFKDPEAFERAIIQASQESQKINPQELDIREAELNNQELTILRKQQKIVEAIAEETITKELAKSTLAKLQEELDRIVKIRKEIKQLRIIVERDKAKLEELHKGRFWFLKRFYKLEWEDKRKLLRLLFDGEKGIIIYPNEYDIMTGEIIKGFSVEIEGVVDSNLLVSPSLKMGY